MALRISTDQMQELARQRFESRLVALILGQEPGAAAALDTPAGRAELRRQCERARSYGLTRDVDLARYVVCAWLMGRDFDRDHGAMREVLTSPSLTPAQKAEAIGRIALAVLRTLART